MEGINKRYVLIALLLFLVLVITSAIFMACKEPVSIDAYTPKLTFKTIKTNSTS